MMNDRLNSLSVEKCSECGSSLLLRDTENAEVVCANCGFVVKMGLADRGPEWRSESFLNFYKAIELITNEFRKDFDERLASQLTSTILNIVTDKEIKDLRTPRRLIHFTCEKIGLNPSCNLSSILDLRNSFSAHARLKEINVPDEDYIDCKSLSAKIILWYLQFIKVEN